MSDCPFLALAALFGNMDEEGALHEACHAVTLGIRAPFDPGTPMHIGQALDWSRWPGPTEWQADWNEVITCSAEIRAMLMLGWDLEDEARGAGPDGAPIITRLARSVLGGNVTRMNDEMAESMVERMVWTEASYRRARAAIDAARATVESWPSE